MIITGSGICLVLSVLVTIFMVLKSYEHIDIYDGAVSLLLPFLILAYWLKAQVDSPEAALVLIAFIAMKPILFALAFSTIANSFWPVRYENGNCMVS